MKQIKHTPAIILLSLTTGLLASCAIAESAPEAGKPSSKANVTELHSNGVPGGVTTMTAQKTVKIVAIDYDKRSVTFEDDKGVKKSLVAGAEVVNFAQIKKGDLLKVTYVEEVVVYLREKGAPANDGAGIVAARAAQGEKPAVAVAATNEVTAVVKAIDVKAHTATLQFPDGSSKTVAVRPDVDLSKRKTGEEVVINITAAIAIAVEKP